MKVFRSLIMACVTLSLLSACGQSAGEHYARAKTAYFAGDFAKAHSELVSALRKAPANATFLALLVQNQLRMNDPEGASAALDRLRAAGATGPGFARLDAETSLKSGKAGAALDKLGADNHPEAWRVRAAAQMALGDRAAAGAAFRNGLAAGGSARLVADYAAFALDDGDRDTARSLLGRLRQLAPDSLEARMLAGRMALLDGKVNVARDTFQAASDAFPTRFEPRMAQADLLERAGRFKEAEQLVDAAGSLAPDEPSIGEARLRLLAEQGQWSRIRDIMQSRSDDIDPASAQGMTYAEALLRLGQPEQARAIFRRTLLIMPDNRYARMMTGEAALAAGDADGAYVTLEPLTQTLLANRRELELAAKAAEAGGYGDEAEELSTRLRSPQFAAQQALVTAGENAMARQDWTAALANFRKMTGAGNDAALQQRIAWLETRAGKAGATSPQP